MGRADLALALRQRVSGIVTGAVDAFLEITKEILDYACGGGLHQPVQVELGTLINESCDFGG